MRTLPGRYCAGAAGLALLLVPFPARTAKRSPHPDAQALLDDMRNRCDIMEPGAPAFRLTARLKTGGGSGRPSMEGSVVLTWLSPGTWREEIRLPGFEQGRVAREGKVWTARSLAFEPVRVWQLEELLDIYERCSVGPGETPSEIKNGKEGGARVRCVEIAGSTPGNPGADVCADMQSGLPAQIRDKGYFGDPWVVTYKYGEYAPWGGKQFPRWMRAFEGANLAVEVRAELNPPPPVDASMLAPPPQAVESDGCDHPMPAYAIDEVRPRYPELAMSARRQGMVSLYLVVAADGSVEHLAVARSTGPDFDAASTEAVKRWRYHPASCGGKPVESERVENITFSMQP